MAMVIPAPVEASVLSETGAAVVLTLVVESCANASSASPCSALTVSFSVEEVREMPTN
eukprot:CAMPEP_0198289622 /NCGR_PEP_ID=MMETSP1449-20131203/7743_1 /TAXON_ID=420275 /ORGANISM="Attheya septentrionalis, Strain CCMP2084" /LENGTH=57 /DNA_ID=CAMNT_0043987975 /DNA_START=76 /DNA_END=249 /DNA_ORIENTATION=+